MYILGYLRLFFLQYDTLPFKSLGSVHFLKKFLLIKVVYIWLKKKEYYVTK